MPNVSKTRTTADVRPVSVTPRIAAKMLSLHYDTVGDMLARGVFTAIAPHGRGPGKRVFLHTDEVELYGETRDESAVRALRVRKRRIKAR